MPEADTSPQVAPRAPDPAFAPRFVAPVRYLTAHGAVARVGPEAAAVGRRVLVVHGEHGWPAVREEVATALRDAGLGVATALHAGYVTESALARLEAAAHEARAELVVAVGGGRVLDAGKGAADRAQLPVVLIPTSPATCSGATAVVVDYDAAGAYLGSRRTATPPAVALCDPELLAAAPDRLLAAGLIDAIAKAVEVRLAATTGRAEGATAAAAVALCERLEAWVFAWAERAVAAAAPDHPDRSVRREAAETAMLWPGLIGGIAGEAAKLAAAHAVHNALTTESARRDPTVRAPLHGEILGFGILVQKVLEGAAETELARYATLFARLGAPADLGSLGHAPLRSDEDRMRGFAARTAAMPPLRASFPDADGGTVLAAFRAADRAARDAADGAGTPARAQPART